MFNPNKAMIDAFVTHTQERFVRAFAGAPAESVQLLEQATQTALETLLSCDCPYHDVQHTMLVADIGQTMLHGRQLLAGDVDAEDWLHAVIAMLFHDIGYIRGLLPGDTSTSFVTDEDGTLVTPEEGCTDASLTPYHVTRSALYVADRFRKEHRLDAARLVRYVSTTQFPVPKALASTHLDDFAGLVRAADLLGQMADPLYLQKLSRLFAEFLETGEAQRQGFKSAGALRAKFPDFFYSQVQPFVGESLKYLRKSLEGQQWIANLVHHLHSDDEEINLKTLELNVASTHLLHAAS